MLVLLAVCVMLTATSFASPARWSIQEKGFPNRFDEVRGLSCRSSIACTAVGVYFGPVAAGWDGESWASGRVPKPPATGENTGIDDGGLSGVSCPSSNACMAVGTYGTESGWSPYAELWNGKRWSLTAVPTPRGRELDFMAGISCPSSRACTAVGSLLGSSGDEPFAVRWDGNSWSVQAMPAVAGGAGDVVSGVSCPSSRSCIAVGYLASNFPIAGPQPFAERWDGTSWTILTAPDVEGNFSGVSCASSTVCMAVGGQRRSYGTTGQATLSARWDGTSWTVQRTPNTTISDQFSGVSCPSASACTAVGTAFVNPDGLDLARTLAERWNGTGWVIQPTPNHRDAVVEGGSYLWAVACASTAGCFAGGGDQNGFGVLLQWNARSTMAATLTGIPTRCVRRPIVVRVIGSSISSVAWSLGGSKLSGRILRKGRTYATSIRLSPGRHRLTVKVRFRRPGQTPPRTFRRSLLGCPVGPPEFTG